MGIQLSVTKRKRSTLQLSQDSSNVRLDLQLPLLAESDSSAVAAVCFGNSQLKMGMVGVC
jgi:hypothetical protein